MKSFISLLVLLIMLAGCAPAPALPPLPTVIPFPTMTPGRAVAGMLPTSAALLLDGQLSNPATLAALAIQATATPNFTLCPSITEATLDPRPITTRDMHAAIIRFLNAGGSPAALENALRTEWGVMGANGFVRVDFDLTGEGGAETVISYLSPEDGGTLLIAGCANGETRLIYEAALGGEAPQILWTSDMTFDGKPELLFAALVCTGDGEEGCAYRTQLATWRADVGRMVNLLGEPLVASRPPTIEDVDQDQVSELLIRLDDDGDAASGPQRTGILVYDWNGGAYVRSLTRLDPPTFRIQVIHLADAAFASTAYEEAIGLYELVLTDSTLRNWQNDDAPVLQTYALYRLMLAYSFLEDERRITLYQTIQTTYPDPAAAPVYIQMALSFWNALQVTNNLRSACTEVQAIISARSEAVGLLNRYGSASPSYQPRDLCPF
jgi:hypothetical protein